MESKNIDIQTENPVCEKSHSQSQSQVNYSEMTMPQLYEMALAQIEYDYFPEEDQGDARSIAWTIAEIYGQEPSEIICLNKNKGIRRTAKRIAETFSMLTHEHVEYVIYGYKKVKYNIRCPESYLRAALYNAVREIEAKIDNELRAAGVI